MVYTCLNGEFLELHTATVPVNQSGLFYGTGCFETLLYTSGEIQYWKKHFNRLCEGLIYLGIHEKNLPVAENLFNNISTLLQRNSMEEKTGKIRIQCSIDNEQGYSQTSKPDYFTFITVSDVPVRGEGYSLKIADTRTIPSACRPSHLKLSNMLHFRDAFRDARRSGFQDALMLNSRQHVAESSIANIFWIKGDTIFTPSAACDILPGILRGEVINYLRTELNMKVSEGKFSADSVLQSDAVWVTNSLMLAQPVDQIEQFFFKRDHPVMNKVIQYFSIE